MQRVRGFTLIELVVTLTVAAILTALAVPSFKTTIQNNRLVSESNDLLSALLFARSQAVSGGATQGANVTVCASSDGDSCNSTNWANGWVIRGNTSAPTLPAVGGATNIAPSAVTLLKSYVSLPSGTLLDGGSYGSSIGFTSNGTLSAAPTGSYFYLCDSRGSKYGRAIYLGVSGEARVSTTVGYQLDGKTAIPNGC